MLVCLPKRMQMGERKDGTGNKRCNTYLSEIENCIESNFTDAYTGNLRTAWPERRWKIHVDENHYRKYAAIRWQSTV